MNILFLFLTLLLSGCYAIGAPFSLSDLEKDPNTDVYACGRIGGPPPTGLIEFVVVPKGSPVPDDLPRC